MIVLSANVVGCAIFAAFTSFTGVLGTDVHNAVIVISEQMMQKPPMEKFLAGIMAGWLITALVWMLPSSEGNEFIVITLMTYLIAAGDFNHVVAGTVEALFLVFEGSHRSGSRGVLVLPADALGQRYRPHRPVRGDRIRAGSRRNRRVEIAGVSPISRARVGITPPRGNLAPSAGRPRPTAKYPSRPW